MFQSRCRDSLGCEARIPALSISIGRFQSRCRDSLGCELPLLLSLVAVGLVSVPLPGFTRLRGHSCFSLPFPSLVMFQSRCRDSLGCEKIRSGGYRALLTKFQSRCRDSLGCEQKWQVTHPSKTPVVSVPLPGFTRLRVFVLGRSLNYNRVSVPLPGFTRLRA